MGCQLMVVPSFAHTGFEKRKRQFRSALRATAGTSASFGFYTTISQLSSFAEPQILHRFVYWRSQAKALAAVNSAMPLAKSSSAS